MRKGGFVKMKHHTNKKKRLLWIVTGIVLIYCAILLAAHHIDRGLSPDNDSSGYGDLTERFSAKYSINYKGKVYEYREKQLVNILLLQKRHAVFRRKIWKPGGLRDAALY